MFTQWIIIHLVTTYFNQWGKKSPPDSPSIGCAKPSLFVQSVINLTKSYLSLCPRYWGYNDKQENTVSPLMERERENQITIYSKKGNP